MQQTTRVFRQNWSGPGNVRTTNGDDTTVAVEHAAIVLVLAVIEF